MIGRPLLGNKKKIKTKSKVIGKSMYLIIINVGKS